LNGEELSIPHRVDSKLAAARIGEAARQPPTAAAPPPSPTWPRHRTSVHLPTSLRVQDADSRAREGSGGGKLALLRIDHLISSGAGMPAKRRRLQIDNELKFGGTHHCERVEPRRPVERDDAIA